MTFSKWPLHILCLLCYRIIQMMSTLVQSLLLVTLCVTMVTAMSPICPPACDPPANMVGCMVFRRASSCKQNIIDTGIDTATCGCMWQEYIAASDKNSKITFTDDGDDCYTWAAVTCGLHPQQENPENLGRELALGIVESLRSLSLELTNKDEQPNINLTAPEEVKNRRRNGVPGSDMDKTVTGIVTSTSNSQKTAAHPETKGSTNTSVEFIGRPHSAGNSLQWIEVEPTEDTSGNKVVAVKRHKVWFLSKMQDDEFKLWVFVAIVVLNIIIVLLAVFCTSDQKREPKEVRPLGDLDSNMYMRNKKLEEQSPIRKFVKKLQAFRAHRTERNSKYTQMDGVGIGQVGSGNQSPRRPSKGLYDFLDDSDDVNNTYEEPIFLTRPAPAQPPHYSTTVQMQTEDQPRTVSFSLPTSSDELVTDNRRNNRRGGGPPILSMGKYLEQ